MNAPEQLATAADPRPDFLWVGQGKSGSTLCYSVISQHPSIFMGKTKEHDFFSKPGKFKSGADYYRECCLGRVDGELFGDISPSYYMKAENIDRIVEFYEGRELPRIIFAVRNPVSFYRSRYYQNLKAGKSIQSRRKIPNVNKYIRNAHFGKNPTLIDKLRYVVERLGGPENICLLVYEDDFSGQYEFEGKIYRFLGVDDSERYYQRDAGSGVNAGLTPHFILPSPKEREIEIDGALYRIPSDVAVFCSGPRKAVVIENPSRAQLDMMAEANEEWQKPLDTTLMDRIFFSHAEPYRAYVKETFGREITSWGRRISPRPYPLGLPPQRLLVRAKPPPQKADAVSLLRR